MTQYQRNIYQCTIEEEDISSDKLLTLVSYNILSASSSKPQFFKTVDIQHLYWNNRKDKILADILQHQPDIISLQEVDKYRMFFYPSLNEQGYDSSYIQRPTKLDGCATFYNRNKYYQIGCIDVQFNDISELVNDDASMKKRVTTHNVGHVLALSELEDDAQIVFVANCHLHWVPGYVNVFL
eukprot:TRINITY_DN3290_c0_g3_i1.p1 TRINITY_DN3290_c0_g3~~TRINITY_DN3290_c0_g3_i1.p1  ORF type:complete len:182 (-),score=31.34 TRINITY_DN3290_c0_g3_i1:474-1019(-)